LVSTSRFSIAAESDRAKPARDLEGRILEAQLDPIFLLDPGAQHVELELADDADDPVRADGGPEQANDSLFGEVVQAAPHLLDLHRIVEPDPPQDLRREVGQAGERHFAPFGEGVPDPKRSVVGNSDDVAGHRDIGQLPVAGEEGDRVVDGDRLADPRIVQLHSPLQSARADPDEGDPVAVVGVHVRLDLEHEAGDPRVRRVDRLGARRLRLRAAERSRQARPAAGRPRTASERFRNRPGSVAGIERCAVEFRISGTRQAAFLAERSGGVGRDQLDRWQDRRDPCS
jgi:hypothetical protein